MWVLLQAHNAFLGCIYWGWLVPRALKNTTAGTKPTGDCKWSCTWYAKIILEDQIVAPLRYKATQSRTANFISCNITRNMNGDGFHGRKDTNQPDHLAWGLQNEEICLREGASFVKVVGLLNGLKRGDSVYWGEQTVSSVIGSSCVPSKRNWNKLDVAVPALDSRGQN
jgi:hypothetical protein